MDNKVILDIKGISKSFPGVQALTDVDFTLREGEIHALMGENGAGKSTLIKVLTGVYKRDEGEILYDGKSFECSSPLQAQESGISPVYQEVNLVPNLSVAENIFLGRQPIKNGLIDWKTINNESEIVLKRFDLNLDVSENLGNYPVAIQQMVAIARALELKSRILILDEPTSSLNVQETEQLFTQMRRLKAAGHAIIFITHFLDQVYQITDTITVLRNGGYIGTWPTTDLSKIQLISKLLGKEMEKLSEVTAEKLGGHSEEELSTRKTFMSTKGLGSRGGIKPFDIEIKTGEVLGCAGLLGSGRTEVANLLFGIDNADIGTMTVDGKEVKINSPGKALKHGIGLSPEDRKDQGIIGDLSVRENVILALQNKRGWAKPVPFKEQQELADKYITLLNIKTPSANQAIKNLSGGNQQKVV
ncbi:MAG: sugar ABC transporter ATP-binding protein, partial [Spirochaetes bacterium]